MYLSCRVMFSDSMEAIVSTWTVPKHTLVGQSPGSVYCDNRYNRWQEQTLWWRNQGHYGFYISRSLNLFQWNHMTSDKTRNRGEVEVRCLHQRPAGIMKTYLNVVVNIKGDAINKPLLLYFPGNKWRASRWLLFCLLYLSHLQLLSIISYYYLTTLWSGRVNTVHAWCEYSSSWRG